MLGHWHFFFGSHHSTHYTTAQECPLYLKKVLNIFQIKLWCISIPAVVYYLTENKSEIHSGAKSEGMQNPFSFSRLWPVLLAPLRLLASPPGSSLCTELESKLLFLCLSSGLLPEDLILFCWLLSLLVNFGPLSIFWVSNPRVTLLESVAVPTSLC